MSIVLIERDIAHPILLLTFPQPTRKILFSRDGFPRVSPVHIQCPTFWYAPRALCIFQITATRRTLLCGAPSTGLLLEAPKHHSWIWHSILGIQRAKRQLSLCRQDKQRQRRGAIGTKRTGATKKVWPLKYSLNITSLLMQKLDQKISNCARFLITATRCLKLDSHRKRESMKHSAPAIQTIFRAKSRRLVRIGCIILLDAHHLSMQRLFLPHVRAACLLLKTLRSPPETTNLSWITMLPKSLLI